MKNSTFNSIGKKTKTALFLFSLGFSITLSARENIGGSGGGHRNNSNNSVMATGCSAGSTQQEIQLNNVRTRVLTDGDMWWDFSASIAKYEIPKGSNSYAQFAGSLWFGGYVNNAIHMSAMTYRQNGIDFWPGPLNPTDLSISVQTCQAYDKVWTFNRNDVASFYAYWQQYGSADPNTPSWIKDYPGNPEYPGYNTDIPNGTTSSAPLAGLNGVVYPMNYLAPYYDINADGLYNYASGDYPAYIVPTHTVSRGQCVRYLFGDQTLFFVFNDNGNAIHGETGGQKIGVEIRGQAFEFSTSDQLNDMTFYNYEIINWSSNKVDSTYFTVWDDCDLGNYQDDYVGCDVSRGLGYQYNGDNYDEDVGGQTGYHDKLPAIGCDFFQGPYANLKDSIDNDRDGCVDCSWQVDATGHPCPSCGPPIMDNVLPEQCIMSRFTYYNNTGSTLNGNPPYPNGYTAYYNLMAGKWETGTPMTYGAQGLTATGTACKFLYPGTSDPNGWGLGYKPLGYGAGSAQNAPIPAPAGAWSGTSTGWTEAEAGNAPGDRRFMQSAGKFTLLPGAVNYVTFGLPFARSNSNNNLEPIPLMFAADDKAQALFDNCFKVLDGPDAPDLTIQELNQQLLITLTNNPYTSNNYEAKRYADFDPSIVLPAGITDNVYRFEGYQIYQLLDGTVSVTDLTNANLARLIFQCDIKNGVSKITNFILDPAIGQNVPQVMVTGADAGIQNSFSVTKDLFAVSDTRLVNFKNYYFIAVAYAYNNFLTYAPDVPPTTSVTTTGTVTSITYSNPPSGDYNGQKVPYLQGRNNIKVATGIPHNPSVEANGTIMNSSYGNGPAVTRVEGQGNGGYALDLTDQTVANILSSPVQRAQTLTYVANRAPINVKVIDPLRVVKGDFTVKMIAASAQTSGSSTVWSYNGNPPNADPTTLDTGRLKNIATIKWFMTGTYTDVNGNKVTKTWLSDEGLSVAQEKIITGLNNESLGFSITIQQVSDPQMTAKIVDYTSTSGTTTTTYSAYVGSAISGDLLESSISYAGSGWLTGIPDIDLTNQDWILAGNNIASSPNDIFGINPSGTKFPKDFADPGQVWEGVVGGTWAPYRMVNQDGSYPGFSTNDAVGTSIINNTALFTDTRLLSSVDIVFTSDQSKWTRCPVVDMNTNKDPDTGLPYKWQLRRAKSVDKNGNSVGSTNSNYNNADATLTADSSMGWFPGYAINIETGERLNIIFSENSADSIHNNGNDMLWNPTSTIVDANGNTVYGGMHYVYILGHNADGIFSFPNLPTPNTLPADVGRYDAGQTTYQMLKGLPFLPLKYSAYPNTATKKNKWSILAALFRDIMWCSMPLSSVDLKHNPIPGDAKVKIRVPKPFRYGLSTVTSPANASYSVATTTAAGNLVSLVSTGAYSVTPLNSDLPTSVPADVLSSPQNGNFPMYTFSTNDLVASIYQSGTAQAGLALINIVPNPYYAHDAYEATRIDLLVKIINLPVKCTINIYTLSGTLIRTLSKDNSDTYMTWDLHNSANIQVASGLYVLHIDAPGIGERVIKWYGIMRPYDLQSY
jgi:hypothetical protein